MNLTEMQRDALSELLNMGFARTAASLSELTGRRVLLEVPQVSMHPIAELSSKLATFVTGEVATVQQIFTGHLSGNALLLLNYDGALMLTDLVSPEPRSHPERLDTSSAEILTEIGNILLNACLSVFGNLLEMQISFSVPRLHLEALDGLLHSLNIGHEEMQYAVVVYTGFRIKDNAVSGYLVIILSVVSLKNLIEAVDRWVTAVIEPENVI